MKRRFDLYLKDILQAIEHIQEYLGPMEAEDFLQSGMAVDAALRNLEIIGEAATQLPAEIQGKYPHVLWRDIQDFRIVVAHHYWNVNKERIWDIIQHKLEPLKRQIADILVKEEKENH